MSSTSSSSTENAKSLTDMHMEAAATVSMALDKDSKETKSVASEVNLTGVEPVSQALFDAAEHWTTSNTKAFDTAKASLPKGKKLLSFYKETAYLNVEGTAKPIKVMAVVYSIFLKYQLTPTALDKLIKDFPKKPEQCRDDGLPRGFYDMLVKDKGALDRLLGSAKSVQVANAQAAVAASPVSNLTSPSVNTARTEKKGGKTLATSTRVPKPASSITKSSAVQLEDVLKQAAVTIPEGVSGTVIGNVLARAENARQKKAKTKRGEKESPVDSALSVMDRKDDDMVKFLGEIQQTRIRYLQIGNKDPEACLRAILTRVEKAVPVIKGLEKPNTLFSGQYRKLFTSNSIDFIDALAIHSFLTDRTCEKHKNDEPTPTTDDGDETMEEEAPSAPIVHSSSSSTTTAAPSMNSTPETNESSSHKRKLDESVASDTSEPKPKKVEQSDSLNAF
jgi:hypothetical protein